MIIEIIKMKPAEDIVPATTSFRFHLTFAYRAPDEGGDVQT